MKVSNKSDIFLLNKILLRKLLLKIMILFLPHNLFKNYQKYYWSHFRSKVLFNKKLSDFVETFTYFYQMPYSKNFKVWTKLNNSLLNKIFVGILTLFFAPDLTLTSALKIGICWLCELLQFTLRFYSNSKDRFLMEK